MSTVLEGSLTSPNEIRRSLRARPEAVQEGRLLVETQAARWKIERETIDSAVLVVSELLTNSARATPDQSIILRMTLIPEGFCIEVWDASPQMPEPSSPDLTMPSAPVPDDAPDPGGWGLDIVATLSESNGCRPEQKGKTAWAILKVHSPDDGGRPKADL